MNNDPSKSSHYINDQFYRNLVDNFSDWQHDENEITDLVLRDSCRRFLETEARLLESLQHDEWLSLFTPECLYWVPASVEGGDPRKEVAIAFDDRRRLEDRVFRLQNEFAWSQQPVSRTSRVISNVTLYTTGHKNEFMARSNFITTEFQAGDKRVYAGWMGHRLVEVNAGWKILVKQVNLIDCDQNLRNPSITL